MTSRNGPARRQPPADRFNPRGPWHLPAHWCYPRRPFGLRLCRPEAWMLAIVAAVIFVIAFLLEITGRATNVVFAPISLMFLGLACLALHIAGIGASWHFASGRRRRLLTRQAPIDTAGRPAFLTSRREPA